MDDNELQRRAGAVRAKYEAHFAGQARITRDAGLLDTLGAELKELRPAATGEALAEIDRDIELYAREAVAVREAQSGGPQALEAHLLEGWARFNYGRYRRNFANQSRSTRDAGLLQEMISELERLDGEMARLSKAGDPPGLSDARAELHKRLDMYKTEQREVAGSRGAGTLEEQGGLLARLANDQFQLYRGHFAGKSRVSRRPALITRMLGTLEGIRERMEALRAQGHFSEHNEGNLKIITQRQEAWRGELEAIRAAKQQAGFDDLVNALGEAANKIFEEYRANFAGKDRASRDLEVLNRLFEALYHLARQMDDLDRVREDEANEHNLSVVLDSLRLYDREDARIREAKTAE